ncbi:MAG: RagB/SusD family nutrient uptake outer membrane protein [Muribaculaceae bacterium]|nr:RagB/SusD family nutrient uptake outer membrane protein [Muribaculaceae bacterium]
MKKILYSLLVASAALVSGCSENYLELSPTTSPTPAILISTTENARYAINGLGRLQSNQYISQQGCSGEGGMAVWYGEFPGNDMVHNRWNSTWYTYANFNRMLSSSHWASMYPWLYNYKMISNANVIINNIDQAEGPENEKQFIKAQALTYRAHAYTWLVRTYCRRWVDSRNGESRGVVLRTGNEPDDQECATLAESYKFIYDDLDEAIALYKASGLDRSSDPEDRWNANEDVAHAIYARAALARQDWNTAATQAALASAKYPLMSSDEYRAGFSTANKEWIWMAYNDKQQTLSYYGPFAYLASNSNASVTRGYGNIISKQLSDLIPQEDTRLWLYGIPKPGDKNTINTTSKPGNITRGDLYNRYLDEYYDRYNHESAMTYYAYAVMKFQRAEGIADGCWVLYRSAEMVYTQAEALFELGKETDARNLLISAVKPYQPNYTCNLTGEALRDEIRLYRRFDLLGEGHNWYDFKRWNLPITRLAWKEGGTWPDVFCGDGHDGGLGGNYGPSDKNHWCVVIPDEELNFNRNVNYAVEPETWTKGYEVNNPGEPGEPEE